METKKKQPESSSRDKVLMATVRTTVGVFASLISAIIGSGSGILSVTAVGATGAAAITTVVLSASLTSVLVRRERGSSKIAKLKDDISAAYLSALESSALNHKREGCNEH